MDDSVTLGEIRRMSARGVRLVPGEVRIPPDIEPGTTRGLDIQIALAGFRTSWWPVSGSALAWIWRNRRQWVSKYPHCVEMERVDGVNRMYEQMVRDGLRVGIDGDTLVTLPEESRR
jgi:hypothetical protein